MKLSASAASALAIVTAVGRPRATSAAKLGPDMTAKGDAGNISAPICDIVASEPASIPLAQCSSGSPGAATAAQAPSTPRRNWAGTTSSAASASTTAASRSPLARNRRVECYAGR